MLNNGHLFSTISLLTISALLSCVSQAAPDYQASVIEVEATITDQHFADLDGDGMEDLVIATWSMERGRELLVYVQGANGHFPGKPSQRIEIKKDIVAFAMADLREEPGTELILFSRGAAYSYSSRKEGYAGNLKKLFDWELVATVPERKSLPFFGKLQDYNEDGHVDLLLPGRERYALGFGDGQGGFQSPIELPRPHRDLRRNTDKDIRFDVSFAEGLTFTLNSPSPFDDLLPRRESAQAAAESWDRYGRNGSILDIEHWLASVRPARINDDPVSDFVYLDDPEHGEGSEGAVRFNAIFQLGEGAKRSPDWQGQFESAGEVLLDDFNGDGLDDVILLNARGSDQTNLLFFANRGGRYEFDTPDQVIRFAGYEVEVALHDLDGDEIPELIVSYYGLAAVEALRSGSMLRTTLIYKGRGATTGGEGGVKLWFAQRPSAKLEDRFSADNVRGLVERLNFSVDLDGDSRKDVIALDETGTLVAKSVGKDLQIASEPFWRFVPLHFIQEVIPAQLNRDAVADFLLRHQYSVTVLVSRP